MMSNPTSVGNLVGQRSEGLLAAHSKKVTYVAIILYFRRGPTFHLTLDSLLASSLPPAKIVVVDNHSEDGVVESLAPRYPEVSFVETPFNLGYAAGMNFGVEQVTDNTDAFLFMTHEVLLEQNCVANLVTEQILTKAAVVGPRLILPDGKAWSRGGIVNWTGSTRHIVEPSSRTITWLDGACLLIPSGIFYQIHGFDEDYYLYYEDVDLCLRAGKIASIVCAYPAVAIQDTGTTPPYFRARNRVLLWRKHRRWDRVAITLFIDGIRAALALVSSSKSVGVARAFARGSIHGLSGTLTRSPDRWGR